MKKIFGYLLTFIVLSSCIGLCSIRELLLGYNKLTLSEWQLKLTNHYAYVLPNSLYKKYGWEQEIYIYSLKCTTYDSGYISGSPYIPMQITYRDQQGNAILGITIYPTYFFVPSKSTLTSVEVESEWIKENTTEYYMTEENVHVFLFKDRFDMSVEVWSTNFSKDELTELLLRLEYVGKNPDTMSNPWACDK